MTRNSAPQYGFIIDNRRCIGCHACTVACKTEHTDPIGVNKTWVQYVEKGVWPEATRSFHVLRCNHCSNAPCVEICPTASLETRVDGIVDFDPGRCIGCKARMQACPYDAITLNPETGTATKCNYCSHRVDVGREPACAVVCPAEAIVTGDMADPTSLIARLLAKEETTVRRPEKGTFPKLAYIEGDRAALDPFGATPVDPHALGERPVDAVDLKDVVFPGAGGANGRNGASRALENPGPTSRTGAVRTYDIAQRHAASWGWKVSAYLFTKSIAAGAFLVPALLAFFEPVGYVERLLHFGVPLALLFLAITGVLLVADLKRPERFHWVLLRPQWSSWLVRGAYIITAYGGLVFGWWVLGGTPGGFWSALGGVLAAATAAYSGWLFGQAKGRDLWQSPLVPVHLVVQAIVAGGAVLLLCAPTELASLAPGLAVAVIIDAGFILVELHGRHASEAASRARRLMVSGVRRPWIYGGSLAIGHGLAVVLLLAGGPAVGAVGAVLALAGLLIYEHLWVDAPQRLPLA